MVKSENENSGATKSEKLKILIPYFVDDRQTGSVQVTGNAIGSILSTVSFKWLPWMSQKNYHESYNLTHANGRFSHMTDEIVSQFPPLWDWIIENGLREQVPCEFISLENYWLFVEKVDHMTASWLLPVGLESS